MNEVERCSTIGREPFSMVFGRELFSMRQRAVKHRVAQHEVLNRSFNRMRYRTVQYEVERQST